MNKVCGDWVVHDELDVHFRLLLEQPARAVAPVLFLDDDAGRAHAEDSGQYDGQTV